MNRGWISLHRQIQDHWLWKEKPFSKGQAWIDLIMSASHENRKFILGNTLEEIEKGSFITSEMKLSEKWGWSRHKVRDFLKLLETDNMIVLNKDNKRTAINIVNYRVYQELADNKRTAEVQQKYSTGTTKGQRKDTINNYNNFNNIYTDDFEKWFESYPNKFDKEQTFKNFRTTLKKDILDNLLRATANYIAYIKENSIDKKYIVKSTNFIGQKAVYKNYIEVEQQKETATDDFDFTGL